MVALAALVAATLTARAQAACGGDCAGDGEASAAELKRIVDIINLCDGQAAGCEEVPGTDKQCTSADLDGDGTISAGELTSVIDTDVLSENPDCTPAGLGVRVFTIDQTTGATDPPTGFFTTGAVPIVNQVTEVTNTGSWYVDQPLRLRAGPVDPVTGIAPIRLEQDVIYGYRIIDNQTTVCVRLLAAGSTGQLDCDGGSPQDVQFTVDSNFSLPADGTTYTAHVGNPSRAGALTLDVMGTVDNTTSLASAAGCATWAFDQPNRLVFTTETMSVRITEVASTGNPARYCSLNETRACSNTNACPAGSGTCSLIRLARTAVPFNCANWTQTGSGGRLMTALFGEATQVGDTANIQRIADDM